MSVTIPVSDLTTAELDGEGVFDILMRANKAHLESEFQKNRIKGTEYATVYLGSLESVMQTALGFLMQRQKVALEAQLMAQQILLAEAQTALLVQQEKNAVTEGLVLQAQKCKLDAEYDLLQNQNIKTTAETALLNQKKVTEQAQVTATGVDADSVVGKQKALYGAQTEGFKRDAEQKAADLMLKAWMTRRTTDADNTAATPTNKLDDSSLGQVMSKLMSGIGA